MTPVVTLANAGSHEDCERGFRHKPLKFLVHVLRLGSVLAPELMRRGRSVYRGLAGPPRVKSAARGGWEGTPPGWKQLPPRTIPQADGEQAVGATRRSSRSPALGPCVQHHCVGMDPAPPRPETTCSLLKGRESQIRPLKTSAQRSRRECVSSEPAGERSRMWRLR